jgi:pimeloyl-ACP methyl ester carboxylesterase
MPLAIVLMFVLGLLSLGLLGGGGYIVYEWWQGVVVSTTVVVAGLAMLVVALLGRWIVLAFHRGGRDDPSWAHDTQTRRLERPDGTVLHVELSGPDDAPAVVLTHGWGVDNRAFYYTKRALCAEHRVIAWDLRGLGQSTPAGSEGYSLDAMADDLSAVVELAARPAVLVGHSIGGMITQSFARRHAASLGTRVAGLVLVGTTYRNPTCDTAGAAVMRALERPLFVPLMWLTIALAPAVWAMNWLSYVNGSQLVATGVTGFAGSESRAQLDFATLFFVKARPGVLARGMLAMFRFDESSSIGNITVPVLVVPGDRDPVLKPRASEHIARVIPGAAQTMLPSAKHMGLLEHHQDFNAVVAAFCDERAAVTVRS